MKMKFDKLDQDSKDIALALVLFLSSKSDILFVAETLLETLFDSEYNYIKNFYFDETGMLRSNDPEILNQFIDDLRTREIQKEMTRMVDVGLCQMGVESDGDIKFIPVNMSDDEFIKKVFVRLKNRCYRK